MATTVLNLASSLLLWSEEKPANKASLLDFEAKLLEDLNSCITSSLYLRKKHDGSTNKALNTSQYWKLYHKLILSSTVKKKWIEFLVSSINVPPCAQLQQSVMQYLADALLLSTFPLSKANTLDASDVKELSSDEEQCLRYACGFVMKQVKEEMKKGKKDNMIAAISDLTTLDQETYSVHWMRTIDRGGLTYISQNCYRLFYSIEMETRRFFHNLESLQYGDILKTDIIKSVIEDPDVTYHWSMCTEELLEDEERLALLKIIATKYLRVRGHSFVRSFMETFKQHHSKGTQKSKALRKTMK